MLTIELTPEKIRRLEQLEEGEQIEAEYKGLPCFIAYYPDCGNVEINGRKYSLGIYDPTEWKIKESPIVIVQILFQFLHRDSIVTRFKTYRCCVRQTIENRIKTSPELWDCTSYSYVLTDEKGRLIK